ncbi:hypothetical protein [Streptomyces kronopolitis]
MNPFDRALDWVVAAGADETEVRGAWASGRAVDVPIGPLWGVLRLTTTVARDVIRALDARRIPLGPVLDCPSRATLEFLTPPGHWWTPQLGARLATTGHIRWPAPDVTRRAGRQAQCGRSWIVPPRITVPDHTPISELQRAVEISLNRHIEAGEIEAGAVMQCRAG